jgi:two-component system sensor kinase FixL
MKLPALDRLEFPVFMSDAGGRLTFVNEPWRERFGIELGAAWHDAFPQLDAAALTEQWQACLQGLQPFVFEAHAGGTRYRVICQPAQADDSAAIHVLGALTDITSQSLMQAEAEAILDTAVDAIIIIDEHGRIEHFNQAAVKLFGYQPREAIGRSVNMLMPEPHRGQHDRYMHDYMTGGDAKIIGIGRELEAVDKNGVRIPIYLAVSEVKGDGERRFTGILRDLSEQQATRQALAEQREKLAHVGRLSSMGEMTASIAHEINQPLTAISMYAQAGMRLIDRGEPDLGRLREALDKLNTQSLRAGAVIERIQRFARAQESQREVVDVNALIEDLVKLAEADARLHDMQLALNLADDLPTVFGEPIQIQQVALNLIRNAIDAMNEIDCRHGRRIEIATELENAEHIRISVADLGPGVAEDQMELVFTPFHTTKKEGMGMGLSICRSIIAEHGGILSFANNFAGNEGPGATFFFTLPTGTPDE